MASVFETLSAINVNEHTEKKGRLTYLSWSWAWDQLKRHYPDAVYTIYENADGCIYHTDGRTCWVKTGVTVEGQEIIEYLPVMDHNNRSIPLDAVTSFDVNKAIQRSLTKAVARHGLGLYIYSGEDLPEPAPLVCASCGNQISGVVGKGGELVAAEQVAAIGRKRFGRPLCADCQRAQAAIEKLKGE